MRARLPTAMVAPADQLTRRLASGPFWSWSSEMLQRAGGMAGAAGQGCTLAGLGCHRKLQTSSSIATVEHVSLTFPPTSERAWPPPRRFEAMEGSWHLVLQHDCPLPPPHVRLCAKCLPSNLPCRPGAVQPMQLQSPGFPKPVQADTRLWDRLKSPPIGRTERRPRAPGFPV